MTDEKSNVTSGVTNSMSNATICCLRRRRWAIRKRFASAGDDFVAIWEAAHARETVVL